MNNNYKNTREEVIIELESLLLDCEETEKVCSESGILDYHYFKLRGGIWGIKVALDMLKTLKS